MSSNYWKRLKEKPKQYKKELKKRKIYYTKWRKENVQKSREYSKKYHSLHKREGKLYAEKHKVHIKKYKHKWYLKKKNDNEFKRKQKETSHKWYLNNPEKCKAHNKARQIKIPKGYLCEKCKKNKATEKHHKDYSKPLEVDFLCNKCHNKIKKRRIKYGNRIS